MASTTRFSRNYTPLSEINKNRIDWSIRVRVCRKWKTTGNGRIPQTLEFVFVDKEGTRIQATAKHFLMSLFDDITNEGDLLSVGVPIMLLRNMDPYNGLCNGTRLVVTKLGNYVIQGRVLGGKNMGDLVYIPRINMTPSDPRYPFALQRRQFPIMISYAMSINKSQGQSLSNVGIFLKKPVFTHGQLYVSVSRVTNKSGLKLLLCDENGKLTNKTANVVYKEVFQNL